MIILEVSDIYQCNIWILLNISRAMSWIVQTSFSIWKETYDKRRKHQLHLFQFCLGDTAVRIYGTSSYRIKSVTSWHDITSRNAIESYSKVLYIKIYSWLKYVFLKLIWNFWNVPVRDPEPSQLALSWPLLFMSAVTSSMSFGSLATASNVLSGFIHMYMWLCNILWSLIVHCWKINLLLLLLQ